MHSLERDKSDSIASMIFATNVPERAEFLGGIAALGACVLAFFCTPQLLLPIVVAASQFPSLLGVVGIRMVSKPAYLALRCRWLRDISALAIALGLGLPKGATAVVVLAGGCAMLLRGGAQALQNSRNLSDATLHGVAGRDAVVALSLCAAVTVALPGVAQDTLQARSLEFWCLSGFTLVQLHWLIAAVFAYERQPEGIAKQH